MEGPTTSSAIFYGALSVHIGLFLMLRTYPLWEGSIGLRAFIMALGLLTALIATSITRVQSSAKTQIAYASVTQIGIMFVELAAGLHWLVLFHFVSNAFLRTYQLLISPSIVSYLVHYQFFTFVPPAQSIGSDLIGRIRSTLFVLGVKEWDMDGAMTRIVWRPLKSAGRSLRFLDRSGAVLASAALSLVGTSIVYATGEPRYLTDGAIWASAILGILFFVRAYANTGTALTCWTQILLGQIFASMSLSALVGAGPRMILFYLSGIVAAYLVGLLCLRHIDRTARLDLSEYHGYMYEHTMPGNVFFLAGLALMVFPITPSFIGEEVLLSGVHAEHGALVVVFALGYVLSGISTMRLFAKIFFGPHKKSYHEIAYRSS
jgi:NADH:ubiquinone oxidoreductase subunit 5 (subunit L)/multisubunit Na+/H+ antiporter MnhA subunit